MTWNIVLTSFPTISSTNYVKILLLLYPELHTKNARLTLSSQFRTSPAWQHSIGTTEHNINQGGGMGQRFDRSKGPGPRVLSLGNFENWNFGKCDFLWLATVRVALQDLAILWPSSTIRNVICGPPQLCSHLHKCHTNLPYLITWHRWIPCQRIYLMELARKQVINLRSYPI